MDQRNSVGQDEERRCNSALQDCLGRKHDVKTDECCGVDIAAFFLYLCSLFN